MRHTLRYERERERENLGILELLSQAEFMRHTLIATFSGNQCMTRKLKAILMALGCMLNIPVMEG